MTQYPAVAGSSRNKSRPLAAMSWSEIIETTLDATLNFITSTVSFIVTIAGPGALLIADVALGAVVLGELFKTPVNALWFTLSPSTLGGGISLATSAVQLVVWRFFFSSKSISAKGLALIAAICIAILDTTLDTSLTNVLINNGPPKLVPETSSGIYWIAWALIMLITGFNEALVNLISSITRTKSPGQKMILRPNRSNRTKNQSKHKQKSQQTRRRRK